MRWDWIENKSVMKKYRATEWLFEIKCKRTNFQAISKLNQIFLYLFLLISSIYSLVPSVLRDISSSDSALFPYSIQSCWSLLLKTFSLREQRDSKFKLRDFKIIPCFMRRQGLRVGGNVAEHGMYQNIHFSIVSIFLLCQTDSLG